MRALTWMLVAVLAMGVIGCAQPKEEELPALDMGSIEAPPADPATVAVPVNPSPAVTPIPDEPQPAVAVPTSQTYTMQGGDTLYSLAKRFYGDGKLWTKIADANKDKVRDITKIPVGTLLTIPPK